MNKTNFFKGITASIILLLVIYSVYWLYTSIKFKSNIIQTLSSNNIQSSEVNISGYPYRLEANLKNTIVELNNDAYFKIEIPELKISVSPTSLRKILIQSESSLLSYKDLIHSLNINNEQSRMTIIFNEGQIQNLSIIFEENNVNYKSLIFGTIKKTFNNILIDGKINYNKNILNGNLQVSIYEEDGSKKFTAPINIKNNKIKLLFFEFDLSNLF
jgi:hypothetical protein|tara:strand:+ start:16347 stop:16991 length:645 start_codon:yes stop_codon:yes gene_type:complete